MNDLQIKELEARKMAHGCKVYAPPKSVDPGIACYNATRTGSTSAACADRWIEARAKLKEAGLKPLELDQKDE